MFCKKVLKTVIGGILLCGICNASSLIGDLKDNVSSPMDYLKKTEDDAMYFAKKINSGSLETTQAVDAIKGIETTPEIQVNINLVKNLFIVSKNISNCMVDVHQALLAKQLEIAQGTKLDDLESASNNLKIIALLMYSQIEQKPALSKEAALKSSGTTQVSGSQEIQQKITVLIERPNKEIVETVINRLSSLANRRLSPLFYDDKVNDDKVIADRLLHEFYDLLDDSALSIYVPKQYQ